MNQQITNPTNRARSLTPAVDENTFWREFTEDIKKARCRIKIQSPFLGINRLNQLLDLLTFKVNRGVAVCVLIQEPSFWSTNEVELTATQAKRLLDLRSLIGVLKKRRIHVTMIPKIHAKLALIDDFVLWEGSLNVLSHLDTEERMRRIIDPENLIEAMEYLDKCHVCRKNFKLYEREFSPSSIPKRLRRYRQDNRITLGDLATSCGVSKGRLSEIENSSNNLSIHTLTRLTNRLDLVPMLIPRALSSTVTGLLSQYTETV